MLASDCSALRTFDESPQRLLALFVRLDRGCTGADLSVSGCVHSYRLDLQ